MPRHHRLNGNDKLSYGRYAFCGQFEIFNQCSLTFSLTFRYDIGFLHTYAPGCKISRNKAKNGNKNCARAQIYSYT